MFDPSNLDAILHLEDKDLHRLPASEDELHEYKSSLTNDNELAEKIGKAASGFWNSGGGLFVAGMDRNGRPDGGISLKVGRQSRRDWIDQAIHRVLPPGKYVISLVEDKGSCPLIRPDHAVAIIAFGPSEVGPHMGPDSKYYIRAGAHTETARQPIVEAIWAKRHFAKPRLIHNQRAEHWTNVESFLFVDVIAATSSAAIDVAIDIEPRPDAQAGPSLPIRVNLIDSAHPYSFRMEVPNSGYAARLVVKYHDLTGNSYSYESAVDLRHCLAPWHSGQNPMRQIADQIEGIKDTLQRWRC